MTEFLKHIARKDEHKVKYEQTFICQTMALAIGQQRSILTIQKPLEVLS
jgi:hypothetical protein